MNEISVVYLARVPKQVDQWRARYDLSLRRWQRSVENFQKEHRISDLVIRTDFSGCWIAGYRTDTSIVAPKAGFKRDKRLGYIVPNTDTPEGKMIAERMKSIRLITGSVPGLPDGIRGKRFAGAFKLEKIGENWFATLPFEVSADDLSHVDKKLWKKIPVKSYIEIVEHEILERKAREAMETQSTPIESQIA